MIKKKIKIPIYNQFTLTIMIGKDIHIEVNRLLEQEDTMRYKGIFFYKQNGVDLNIALDIDLYNEGVIAHEAFHAAVYILDYVGINLAEESEEAYAYLIGYIVEQIHKLIK